MIHQQEDNPMSYAERILRKRTDGLRDRAVMWKGFHNAGGLAPWTRTHRITADTGHPFDGKHWSKCGQRVPPVEHLFNYESGAATLANDLCQRCFTQKYLVAAEAAYKREANPG